MLTDYEKKSEPPGYSASDLCQCARRELHYRQKVYAGRVSSGSMTPQQAKSEIAKMTAIAKHFAALAEKERLL